jgi:hypothetical protein
MIAYQVTLRNDATGGIMLVGTVAQDRIGAEVSLRRVIGYGVTITDIRPVR